MTPVELERQLAKLKDFQRRTVDCVFERMYGTGSSTRRFLVSDEVGLGKTMVARGLIAKAIRELEERGIPRIDVVYVCSNAAIAHQNLNRLNVLERSGISFATRLTLLPERLGELDSNRVNFVSFTPGTTFDLKSRAGTISERVLLFRMLMKMHPDKSTALRNLLQGPATQNSWERHLAWGLSENARPLDAGLEKKFIDALARSEKVSDLTSALDRFKRFRKSVPRPDQELRYAVIGHLRQTLARVCVQRLEPDLVILDEFQRFRDLLTDETEAGQLASMLFDQPDVRVLLLSATPYQMLTLAHEPEVDHHQDFIETVRFLLDGDEGAVDALKVDLAEFRHGLLEGGEGDRVVAARERIEGCLRRVMTRTERVRSTNSRDAMLSERLLTRLPEPREVDEYVALDKLARSVEVGDVIEYWKSAPHLLSCMEDYELKQKLLGRDRKGRKLSEETRDAFQTARSFQLRRRDIQNYQPVDSGNARLRALMEESIGAGSWKLLWLPPSLPYIEPTGPYSGLNSGALTKALVFSSWAVAPKAIATMLSYEAERLMIGEQPKFKYDALNDARKPLLTYRVDKVRGPAGMPLLGLLYPCATLAQHIDALELALDLGDGKPAKLEAMRAKIARKLERLVADIGVKFGDPNSTGAADQRWYWATLPLLDRCHASSVEAWIEGRDGFAMALGQELNPEDAEASGDDEGDDKSGLGQHLALFQRVARGEERLGRTPEDLLEVIADLALASPADLRSACVAPCLQPLEPLG